MMQVRTLFVCFIATLVLTAVGCGGSSDKGDLEINGNISGTAASGQTLALRTSHGESGTEETTTEESGDEGTTSEEEMSEDTTGEDTGTEESADEETTTETGSEETSDDETATETGSEETSGDETATDTETTEEPATEETASDEEVTADQASEEDAMEEVAVEAEGEEVVETTEVGPGPLAGVEVCCGGQCSRTDSNGDFTIRPDFESNLLCTMNDGGFAGEQFAIMNIPDGSTQIAVQVATVDGVVVSSGIVDGTVEEAPAEPTEEETQEEESATTCGDGVVDEGEDCDSGMMEAACLEGTDGAEPILCNPDCTIDPAGCGDTTETPMTCGDGVVDEGEDCDTEDLGGEDCTTQGFSGGDLACSAECTFDSSACEEATEEVAAECADEEKICPDSDEAPTCLACSCDDGFEIGDCTGTCADTELPPTMCTGGVGCLDGAEPVCP